MDLFLRGTDSLMHLAPLCTTWSSTTYRRSPCRYRTTAPSHISNFKAFCTVPNQEALFKPLFGRGRKVEAC